MASHTVENYLKALFALANEAGEVHFRLERPPCGEQAFGEQHGQGPSAGWLPEIREVQALKLTAKGKKAAALVVRKHRLTEMFLVEQMGFGWDEVHDIAEQVEHVKAPAFLTGWTSLWVSTVILTVLPSRMRRATCSKSTA